MAHAINENVIRWSEIRLPHPARPGELARWEIDGPFALRRYYRVDGTDELVRVEHFERRNEDGTLSGCLFCGATDLERRAEINWPPIIALAVLGLGLAWFTYGITALLVAYPIWFLYASGPRIQTCTSCKSEYVNFCHGPRP